MMKKRWIIFCLIPLTAAYGEIQIPKSRQLNNALPEGSRNDNPIPANSIPRNSIPQNRIPNNTLPNNSIPSNGLPDASSQDRGIPDERRPIENIPNTNIPENNIPANVIPNAPGEQRFLGPRGAPYTPLSPPVKDSENQQGK